MKMKRQYYAVFVGLLLITFFVFGMQKIGLAVVAIVSGAGLLALIAWGLTTYRSPASPQIVPIYLLTVACLHLHIMEEYLSGFASRMSYLFGIPVFTERIFLTSFAFVGIILWILAGIGLLYRNPLANYAAWFMFSIPVMELSHYIFPLVEGGPYHYFPGMWTAWLPLLPGSYGVYRLWRESRSGPKASLGGQPRAIGRVPKESR
jgi:hypothetical protein